MIVAHPNLVKALQGRVIITLVFFSVSGYLPAFSQNSLLLFPADSLMAMANTLLDEYEIEKAIPVLESVVTKAETTDSPSKLLRDAYTSLGYSYYVLAQYDSSQHHYQQALILDKQLKDTVNIINKLRGLGMNYRQKGLYTIAIEHYLEALAFAQNLQNVQKIAEVNNSIGLLYKEQESTEKALLYFFSSLSSLKALNDSSNLAMLYNNIATCYHHDEKYDSALHYNFITLTFAKPLRDSLSMGAATNNIGAVYLMLDSLQLAEKYIFRAFFLNKSLKDKHGMVIGYTNMADLYLKQQKLSLARSYLDSTNVLIEQLGSKKLREESLALHINLLEAEGNFAKAADLYKEWYALKDEIFQEDKLKVQTLEASFLLQKKENENQRITTEAELAKAAEKRQKLIAFVILIVLGIISILFILLWYSRHLIQKQKIKISEQNALIKTQQDDLRHRTKNVLTRTRGLLRHATKAVKDPELKHILSNTESMLLASASLEEFLYGIDDEKQVPCTRFLEVLIQKLMNSHADCNVCYQVEKSDEFDLPVEIVIPTSMIVVELVSNAIKHAYNHVEKPELLVSLFKSGPKVRVTVKDNGIGNLNDKPTGMGHQLIDKFVAYLHGELKMNIENGTAYTLTFNTH